MVNRAWNPRICEVKSEVAQQILWGLSGLHSDFKGASSCIMIACLKNQHKKSIDESD